MIKWVWVAKRGWVREGDMNVALHEIIARQENYFQTHAYTLMCSRTSYHLWVNVHVNDSPTEIKSYLSWSNKQHTIIDTLL